MPVRVPGKLEALKLQYFLQKYLLYEVAKTSDKQLRFG